jgi:hypothetical protein
MRLAPPHMGRSRIDLERVWRPEHTYAGAAIPSPGRSPNSLHFRSNTSIQSHRPHRPAAISPPIAVLHPSPTHQSDHLRVAYHMPRLCSDLSAVSCAMSPSLSTALASKYICPDAGCAAGSHCMYGSESSAARARTPPGNLHCLCCGGKVHSEDYCAETVETLIGEFQNRQLGATLSQ